MSRPRVNEEAQKSLSQAQEQFNSFSEQVNAVASHDVNSSVPVQQTAPQTEMSKKEIKQYDAPYIKPVRSIQGKDKFNETYRADHTRGWEYVKCIVENKEVIGEEVECWTKAFAGDPAHFWKVPVNKPIYIPRLLAEQLNRCRYHRIRMEDKTPTTVEGNMQFYGAISIDHQIERIACRPAELTFASGF